MWDSGPRLRWKQGGCSEFLFRVSLPDFVNIALGKFGGGYFVEIWGVAIPGSLSTFGRLPFRRGGSQDRPDTPASWALQPMLTRGDSHPCELGTHTHALFCSRVSFSRRSACLQVARCCIVLGIHCSRYRVVLTCSFGIHLFVSSCLSYRQFSLSS